MEELIASENYGKNVLKATGSILTINTRRLSGKILWWL